MNCPHCHKRINVGKLLRSKRPTAEQRAAAKLNGAKGGRPKKPVARMPNDQAQRPLADSDAERKGNRE